VRVGRLPTILMLGLLAVSHGSANEPDGRTILRYSWAPSSRSHGGARLLKVSITAAVPVRDLKLKIEGQSAFRLKPRGSSGSAVALGDLARGDSASLEFDVLVPPSGGGIVAFRVEGETLDGRSFAEGMGVPVGTPGAVPVLRSGAAEFPAASPQAGAP
jgi:hypothetical protein